MLVPPWIPPRYDLCAQIIISTLAISQQLRSRGKILRFPIVDLLLSKFSSPTPMCAYLQICDDRNIEMYAEYLIKGQVIQSSLDDGKSSSHVPLSNIEVTCIMYGTNDESIDVLALELLFDQGHAEEKHV